MEPAAREMVCVGFFFEEVAVTVVAILPGSCRALPVPGERVGVGGWIDS